MSKALLVIDVQNDYFADGAFPLWQADEVLLNTERAIAQANDQGHTVILVQHVADASKGVSPFFNEGTHGVAIHPRILAAAPHSPVIVKQHADSFEQTILQNTLKESGVDELLICGMMTHNCVTHTAISNAAQPYRVTILPDCCATVSEILHQLALQALSLRVKVAT